MKDSLEALLAVAHRYYPREVPFHDPRYKESVEHHRLVEARREAGAAREAWRAMMRRLGDEFPGREAHDDVLCCPAEWLRTSYEGWLDLPAAPNEHAHAVAFHVSFLAPYYVVYGTRTVDDHETTEALRESHRHTVNVCVGDTMWALPRNVVAPEVLAQVDREFNESKPARRREIRFELSPEERSYAVSIAREIEATYGYEPMLPEVGNVIVSEVATESRTVGNARIYDCLLSGGW